MAGLKILTVLGARPQFVKAGAVSREILRQQESGRRLEEIIVHTGQHYDKNMSDIFFDEMNIPKPNYFLGVGGKSHGAMTGQLIEKIEQVALDEKPDYVLVYGDTNSTLAGAIAASKLHIPVAHVEAGLRSFNMKMPEEVNRILTDRISELLFCPTQVAMHNLEQEGYLTWKNGAQALLSGDVMQDAAEYYANFAEPVEGIDGDFVLSTVHRAENTDDLVRLRNIIGALTEVATEKMVVLPLHPRTSKIIQRECIDTGRIRIIQPVGYLKMVWLLQQCSLVMTDSGGLQKEAFFFSKPCITLRDETEWRELIDNKFNVLAGADRNLILKYFNDYQFNTNFNIDLYGEGKACPRIVNALLS